MQITTTITHAESGRKLGKALESVSHINCTLLISFHPKKRTCNLLFTMEHINRGYRRKVLGTHPPNIWKVNAIQYLI